MRSATLSFRIMLDAYNFGNFKVLKKFC